MAYVLKSGHTITNPYDGSASSTAYGIVDDIGINKQRKQIRFDIAVYANRNARVNGLQALATYTVTVSDSTPVTLLNSTVVNNPFTTYFGQSLSTTLWAQIQTYLVAAGLPSPLNIADWQVDTNPEP